ncbi:MAG: transposase [Pirellulales bacterium]
MTVQAKSPSWSLSKQPSYRPMTVTAEEFIRRFLQHVLPRGLQKKYGTLDSCTSDPRCEVLGLSMLVTVTLNMTYTLMGAEPIAMKRPAARCPECGGELECLGVGEHAMLRLRLIAARAQLVDSS